MLTKQVESLSKNYYKVRWNYYKLRQLFYYKVRHGLLQIAMDLLQIATGITKCDDYYKLRQYIHASNIVCGVRGGVGPVWIGKRPKNAKCPKSFVHDCSLVCHRNWSIEECCKSSTWRELDGIQFALQFFENYLTGQRVC